MKPKTLLVYVFFLLYCFVFCSSHKFQFLWECEKKIQECEKKIEECEKKEAREKRYIIR